MSPDSLADGDVIDSDLLGFLDHPSNDFRARRALESA
jgi:hypothetical protein